MKPVVTLGESMGLFRATSIGSIAQISDFQLGIGGAESNVAIGLARLGAHARWVGRVGNDPIGIRITRALRAEGVDAIALVDNEAATGLMIKEQRTSQTTRVLYYRAGSAGSRLSVSDIEQAGIENASLLHVTGITPSLSPSAHDSILSAIQIAKSREVPISFDVNHRATLWGGREYATVYREIAALADIVFAGDDEARILVPHATSALKLAHGLTALGPSQAIVKLGALGAVAVIDDVEFVQPAIAIQVIDTVGAGDAFVAGYLAELVAGLTASERLATATITAAFACLGWGDWESFPTREEFALLERNEPVQR